MNDFRYQKLLETIWRRALTGPEKRELDQLVAARPELRSRWLEDEALNRAFRGLPDSPLPSNFGALVDQAVLRETGSAGGRGRKSARNGFFRFYLPRIAFGLALAGSALLGTLEYQARARLKMARSVAAMSAAAAGPKLEWLENFDAIHELRAAPMVDDELYFLLRTVSATHQMRLAPPPATQFLAVSP
jgi:hypothetical protein